MGLSNVENILQSIVDSEEYDKQPESRVEELLIEVKEAIEEGGGGSGEGDMKKSVYDSALAVANAGGIGAFVGNAVSGKVDKVEGKGLSTNDYSDTEKGKVADNTSAIEAIVNEYGAKNLAPILDFTQKVNQDITWTVIRENGSNNGKVTAVGTASGWSTVNTKNFFLPAGSYIINAGVSDIYHCYVQLNKVSDSSLIASTYGKFSVLFELTNDAELILTYVVYEGATVNDVFACMIRDARITDPTYVPYAMTNKELTDEFTIRNISEEFTADTTYVRSFTVYRYGRIIAVSVLTNDINIPDDTVIISGLTKNNPRISVPVPLFEYSSGNMLSGAGAWILYSSSRVNLKVYGMNMQAPKKCSISCMYLI